MPSDSLDVECTCSGDRREQCDVFVCEQCTRRVPACFGAADVYPEWCDDCWLERAELERAREVESRSHDVKTSERSNSETS